MRGPIKEATVQLTLAPNEARQAFFDAGPLAAVAATEAVPRPAATEVPAYLRETYNWAYLNPRNVKLIDREMVVKVILWGQHLRLRREAFAELDPGQKVLQPACVYGDFSPALARLLGPRGELEVIDLAPIQVASCRRKLRNFPWATVRRADAARPGGESYDAVCCYFLMHELPEDYKRAVADTLLGSVVPGGKVIFVDYHKPHWAHPLKVVFSLIFDTLEPYAKSIWHNEIADFASNTDRFSWRKQTYFGGLFQKVVAQRRVMEATE
jgi:ubiquinone/menaquinone biosynthesis C-methylase UbiE